MQPIHPIHIIILRALRHTDTARYSTLRAQAGLESDVFKFHTRKLVTLALIEKRTDGAYQLSPSGKEYANRLNESERAVQHQPKLSLCVVVEHTRAGQPSRYLLQERKRQPFLHYWGCISGPAVWGEQFEVTAARELAKQTGIELACQLRTFMRVRDYAADGVAILEDKLFAIVYARTRKTLEPHQQWTGGANAWLTLAELESKTTYFEDTAAIIASAQSKRFATRDHMYESHNY